MNKTVQTREKYNNIYTIDADGIKKTHSTIEEALENVKTMYDGVETDSRNDPNCLLGAIYANGNNKSIFNWFIRDQNAKEELETKVGKGIEGVIAREDIISAIDNYDIDFFYNILHAEWNANPRIPGSRKIGAATMELRDVDLEQYGKDWTITDHIQQQMNAHEAGFQTSEVEI